MWGLRCRTFLDVDPCLTGACILQGYLTHKKHIPPQTLQKDHTYGPMVVLGGGAVYYERSTPVFQADILGPWHKFVDFEATISPVALIW